MENKIIMELNSAIKFLETVWWKGVKATQGEIAVSKYCQKNQIDGSVKVIAVGKAAASMMKGLLSSGITVSEGLVITKKGLGEKAFEQHEMIEQVQSSHPVPDDTSIIAGKKLLEFVQRCEKKDNLILLLSGGASSLAEVPVQGYSLQDIQQKTNFLLKSGATIQEINVVRSNVSEIKGGKLFTHFHGNSWTTLAISDVQGDDIQVIGSGIGAADEPTDRFKYSVVASNAAARKAAEKSVYSHGGMIVQNQEILYGDVFRLAKIISDKIHSLPKGVSILGGEPTVKLPEKPGRGGRNQSLALALAIEISGEKNIAILVAGTDGNDGPTLDAGGIITGQTVKNLNKSREALRKADAGTYLAANESLFTTGQTGTNVMDLLIAYRW